MNTPLEPAALSSTVAQGAVEGRRPSTLRLGWERTRLEVKTFFRDRDAAVWTFALPVILLLIFGSVFGSAEVAPGVSFAQYFAAGMIASGIVYTTFQNLAIAIPQERDDGTLKRLQGMPMPKAAYFLGKIGLVLMTFVTQVAILMAVGVLFFSLKLPNSAQRWLTLGWVSLLGLVACTLLGLAFSTVPKTGKGASAIVSPVVLVLQFTSGVFFQYDQLPSWMQQAAAIFPLKWLTQGMRSVFLPDWIARTTEPAGSWELGRVALVLGGWVVLAAVLAAIFFRWNKRGQQ